MAKPKKRRRKIDWERIEQDYRAGLLTVIDIARQNGVTDGAVCNRARRNGWTRDLSNRVKVRARDKLVRNSVNDGVPTLDKQTIEESAEAIVQVVRAHRARIGRLHGAVDSVMDWVERYIEACNNEDEKAREIAFSKLHLGGLFGRTDALPSVMQKLAGTLAKLIELERQSFGLDIEDGKASDLPPLAERLRALQRDNAIDQAPNVRRMNGGDGAA